MNLRSKGYLMGFEVHPLANGDFVVHPVYSDGLRLGVKRKLSIKIKSTLNANLVKLSDRTKEDGR